MAFCHHIIRQLSAFLDDELPEKKRRRVMEHLRACSGCETHLETLRRNNYLLKNSFDTVMQSVSQQDISGGAHYRYQALKDSPPSGMRESGTEETKTKPADFFRTMSGMFAGDENGIGSTMPAAGLLSSPVCSRLIPALLAALGILLLYAPKLNALLA